MIDLQCRCFYCGGCPNIATGEDGLCGACREPSRMLDEVMRRMESFR